MATKPLHGFAVIDWDIIPVTVIRNRKNDRSALLEFPDGTQRWLPASQLHMREAEAKRFVAELIEIKRNPPRAHSTSDHTVMLGRDD